MTKKLNLKTGQIGEEIAKEYLEKKGLKILDKNYKTKYGEIDLVCKQGKELVIVEVRTKVGDLFGSPEESLGSKKLRKLRLNALSYAGRKWWKGDYRVDAVCIVLNNNLTVDRLNHYENIV
jgi:putative endonuclease